MSPERRVIRTRKDVRRTILQSISLSYKPTKYFSYLSSMTFREKLKLYDELVALCPNIDRKGKTVPYTSDNGHMFSLMNKDGDIGFRYSKEIQKKYIEEFNSGHLISYNAVMQGYVLIPDEMFKDLNNLAKLLEESHQYVLSLPPK